MAGGTNRKIPSPQLGTHGVTDEVTFHSRGVTTTGGTLALTPAAIPTWTPAGQTLTRVSAGRYTLTLPVAFKRLLNVIVTAYGPDTAPYFTDNTKGLSHFLRDNDIDNTIPGSALDGTVEIQFVSGGSAQTDADIPDGASFYITCVVAQGSYF
jgi:hypothetical protein